MILRRILSIVPLLLIVSLLAFCLSLFLPGDTAVTLAGENASPERIDEIRTDLGLDDPLLVRYGRWLGDAAQGDFGESLFTKRDVVDEIADRWLVTAQLVAGSVLLAVLVGVPSGIVAARNRGRLLDRLATFFASLGVALPNFVMGMIGIVVFALWLKWLPFAGYVPIEDGIGRWFERMILPTVALSGVMAAEITRLVRSALIDTFEADYIRTARAKGLPERTVVNKHALRVAASPAIAVVGVQIARAFGGAVVVEQVFALPGLGKLTVDSIIQRDLPVLQGVIPLAVLIAVLTGLLSDVLHLLLNPQLREADAS